jgi:hypothetical protein
MHESIIMILGLASGLKILTGDSLGSHTTNEMKRPTK